MDEYEPWKNVERVYIIPYDRVSGRKAITIVKNPSRLTWYDDLIVHDKLFNGAYRSMDIKKCKVLRKDE